MVDLTLTLCELDALAPRGLACEALGRVCRAFLFFFRVGCALILVLLFVPVLVAHEWLIDLVGTEFDGFVAIVYKRAACNAIREGRS